MSSIKYNCVVCVCVCISVWCLWMPTTLLTLPGEYGPKKKSTSPIHTHAHSQAHSHSHTTHIHTHVHKHELITTTWCQLSTCIQNTSIYIHNSPRTHTHKWTHTHTHNMLTHMHTTCSHTHTHTHSHTTLTYHTLTSWKPCGPTDLRWLALHGGMGTINHSCIYNVMLCMLVHI